MFLLASRNYTTATHASPLVYYQFSRKDHYVLRSRYRYQKWVKWGMKVFFPTLARCSNIRGVFHAGSHPVLLVLHVYSFSFTMSSWFRPTRLLGQSWVWPTLNPLMPVGDRIPCVAICPFLTSQQSMSKHVNRTCRTGQTKNKFANLRHSFLVPSSAFSSCFIRC